MMQVAGLLVLWVVVGVAAGSRDKWILYHSDHDIAQAIQDLKTEIGLLKTENGQLKTDIGQLKTDNGQLQTETGQLKTDTGQLKTDIVQLKTENAQLRSSITHQQSTGSGSTYVRWGRTTCPANGSTLAYSGYMAGGHTGNDYPGSVVNYLCLTASPIWDRYDEAVFSGGRVYGVEYEFWNHRADGAAKFFGYNVYNQDAPCAVCHAPRSATMVIPGRNQCYPGWTKEYSGYLVSGDTRVKVTSEFICLDRHPEFVANGAANSGGTKLYLVDGVCGGSLECPPYINNRELTCVVCTK